MARRGPARHDALRSRHAARRRDVEPRAAARSRRQHRVPVELEVRRRVAGARVALHAANEKFATDYPAAVGQPHDEHRLGSFKDLSPSISVFARTSAGRTSAPAGIRTGTSRPISTPRFRTTISGSGSTPRRRRSPPLRSSRARRFRSKTNAESLRSQSQSHLRPLRSLRSQR